MDTVDPPSNTGLHSHPQEVSQNQKRQQERRGHVGGAVAEDGVAETHVLRSQAFQVGCLTDVRMHIVCAAFLGVAEAQEFCSHRVTGTGETRHNRPAFIARVVAVAEPSRGLVREKHHAHEAKDSHAAGYFSGVYTTRREGHRRITKERLKRIQTSWSTRRVWHFPAEITSLRISCSRL